MGPRASSLGSRCRLLLPLSIVGDPRLGPRALLHRVSGQATRAGTSTQGKPSISCPHLLISSTQNHCHDDLLPSSTEPTLIKCGRMMNKLSPSRG